MRCLVLSGGGVGGAYQAGAIKRLTQEGHYYDLYVGVSVGAINASFLSQFSYGSEHVAAYELWDIWWAIRPESVYRKWAGGLLGHLPAAWKGSLYDATPIHNLVDERLSAARLYRSGKKLRVQAVSTSGLVNIWKETDKDIHNGVKASAAYPKIFNPVFVRNDHYIDGAVYQSVPIDMAIAEGATEIDIISTSTESFDSKYIRKNICLKNTPARHPFDFRPKVVHKLMELGYEDALEVT